MDEAKAPDPADCLLTKLEDVQHTAILLFAGMVNEALESKLQHARFIVSSVERAAGSAQKTLLDNLSLLSELKNLKIPASLDDKAVAQIKE